MRVNHLLNSFFSTCFQQNPCLTLFMSKSKWVNRIQTFQFKDNPSLYFWWIEWWWWWQAHNSSLIIPEHDTFKWCNVSMASKFRPFKDFLHYNIINNTRKGKYVNKWHLNWKGSKKLRKSSYQQNILFCPH